MSEGGPGASGDVVAALRAVDGVADASISPDRRVGGAGTLHLTLMPGADEVAVATAVNRILRQHFGLAVDTDNVSVVDETAPVRLSAVPAWADEAPEAEPEPYVPAADDPPVQEPVAREVTAPVAEEEPAGDGPATARVVEALRPELKTSPVHAPRGPRLLIERMQLVAADLGVETEVTLGFDGERWTGHGDGAATPTSVHRAVAAATLRAVEQCVGGVLRLELEHLETPPMGADRAVVVEISMITRRGSERLTGVSSVRDDVRQAVIRATLDALNRRLESYLVPA
jgi:hypothetical protein